MEIKDEISNVIREFERYFLLETLKNKQQGNNVNVSFRDFISRQEYNSTVKKIEEELNNSDGLEKLIFENLTEEQKTRIGGLFHIIGDEQEAVSYNKHILDKQSSIIDSSILNSQEYKDFLNISDSLTKDQKEKLAENLAKFFYSRLSDEDKILLSKENIKRHIMGVGFIKLSRASYKDTINFIKEYSSIFKGEVDVLTSILARYVDEELAKVPISETKQRIKQLKEEARELYRSIK